MGLNNVWWRCVSHNVSITIYCRYNASGNDSWAKHFVGWTTDGTDTPQIAQRKTESEREREMRMEWSPGTESSRCLSSEWSTEGLSKERPHNPVSGNTDQINTIQPTQLLYPRLTRSFPDLIPVEYQTLCCVVSVFVVLKKFTPYKRQEKKCSHTLTWFKRQWLLPFHTKLYTAPGNSVTYPTQWCEVKR